MSDRFEVYSLADCPDDELKEIAVERLSKEGIQDDELALYIANAVAKRLACMCRILVVSD